MATNRTLVSVVMATYNRAHLLPRAIESILNQTFTNFEFIIVDDSSTDNAQTVLKEYQKQDNRIAIIKQKRNKGLASSRNLAIQQAKGNYICFMDDDDFSHPSRIKEQLAFIRMNRQLQACICPLSYINKEGQVYKKQEVTSRVLTTSISHLKEVPRPPFVLNTTTLITHASILNCQSYRSFFGTSEDYDLTLRFQEVPDQAAVLPQHLYYCYDDYGNSSLTRQNYIHIMEDHILAHISAWCRRNGEKDPIDENKVAAAILLKFIPRLPAATRNHLTTYVKRCIYNIYHHLSPNKQTRENISYLNTIINLLQTDSVKPDKLFRTKLWLAYLNCYTKLKNSNLLPKTKLSPKNS